MWYLIVGLLIEIVFLIFVIVYRKKDKKRKLPYYLLKSKKLGSKNDYFKKVIIPEDAEVAGLVQTDFLFFNKGKGVVVYQDLVLKPGLQLQFSEDTKFYSIDLLDVTSETINSKYEQKNNCVNLYIDYLTQNSFYHITILSSEKNPEAVKVVGELAGGVPLTKYARANYITKKLLYSLPYVIAACILLVIIASLFTHFNYALLFGALFFVGYIVYTFFNRKIRTIIDRKVKEFADQ